MGQIWKCLKVGEKFREYNLSPVEDIHVSESAARNLNKMGCCFFYFSWDITFLEVSRGKIRTDYFHMPLAFHKRYQSVK